MSGETFGAMLKRLRAERRLSAFRLARRAFVSQSHLFKMESGIDHPSRQVVGTLAAGLELDGVDTARLFIAAGFWPWRMPDWAVTAFVEAVEEASAMGLDEPTPIRSLTG